MELDDSLAAASSPATSASPASLPPPSPPAPPKRKAGERKKSLREAARHHPAHRGRGARPEAPELRWRTKIIGGGGESATFPDAARAAVPAEDGPTAAGTSEGRTGIVEAVAAKQPVFVDEEAVFNMPEFVEDMARGMLVAPPAIHWEEDEEADTCLIDLSLWKHDL